MEWSLAIQKDWKSSNALMGVPSWTDMVMSRARHPNIIMGTKQYDTKIDEVRDMEGDNICTHPKMQVAMMRIWSYELCSTRISLSATKTTCIQIVNSHA